jgi:hypothetical protein
MVGSTIASWVADPEMPAEYMEWVDGRLAVRVQQSGRDVTTVWIEIGERTVGFEAYVLPAPRHNTAEVHRQLLRRNDRARFTRFAIDPDGEIYLRARLAAEWLDAAALGSVFAEVAETIDVAFRPLLSAGYLGPDPGRPA